LLEERAMVLASAINANNRHDARYCRKHAPPGRGKAGTMAKSIRR
jgi:hypothetical protein